MYTNPILFFIASLGVFNGFLLSLYFLLFVKIKRTSNFLFGLLCLFLSMRIGKSVYKIFVAEANPWVLQIGLSVCVLIGPSLFFYLKSLAEKENFSTKKAKIHFLALLGILLLAGSIKPYAGNLHFWKYFAGFIYAVWFVYLAATVFVLQKIIVAFKGGKYKVVKKWTLGVFASNVLIFIAYIIGYYHLYVLGTITFSIVFYALVLFCLFHKNSSIIFSELEVKYANKQLSTKEVYVLQKKLEQLMKDEALYKRNAIKLGDVSKELGVSSHKFSQFLNDNLQKSFSTFINEYRVQEAKRLLKTEEAITLEAIGYEAGFSSKSSFYAIFKKETSKTPLQYKKEMM